ncbi:hypothetical protein L4D08_26455, partial [Photobacterium chitinilyticum]|uniref:hypothetical protein n=1 Tax=Photobacterium chitinilyticum TaxID=2485123 RepID=UPI003D1132D7
IGYLMEVHAEDFNDIHIIPIFSGYRDKDTLSLVPVTPYDDIINDLEDESEKTTDFKRFSVSLPIREINYAHLHDFQYYDKFKEQEKRYEESKKPSSTIKL